GRGIVPASAGAAELDVVELGPARPAEYRSQDPGCPPRIAKVDVDEHRRGSRVDERVECRLVFRVPKGQGAVIHEGRFEGGELRRLDMVEGAIVDDVEAGLARLEDDLDLAGGSDRIDLQSARVHAV